MLKVRDDLRYWLGLLHYPGVGPIKFAQIVAEFKYLEEIFVNGALTYYVQHKYKLMSAKINWAVVEAELIWGTQERNYILTVADLLYPELLKQIYAPPQLLFLSGNIDSLSGKKIAIVGSRKVSTKGKEAAFKLASDLVQHGFTIVSGLALGVDTAAHLGAIPATIAILPSGLVHIYPAQNEELAAKIVSNGLLISEFPLHTKSVAANFVRRNRIISGLSLAVVVIEAQLKSGTMITANYAIEQNREVFVAQWSIEQNCSGNALLANDGALVINHAQEILDEFT